MGSRNRPYYRVVVADSRMPRDGKFIEVVGHYDPRSEGELEIDEEKLHLWIERGAQATPTVVRLLKRYRAARGPVAQGAGVEAQAELPEGSAETSEGSAETPEESDVETAGQGPHVEA
jgi:small subunit ribosomal protein S16